MTRRSRFIEPAREWLAKNAAGRAIKLREFWVGFSKSHPDLTAPTPERKTPRATCMRDLRYCDAFEVVGGTIRLKS